MEGGKFLASGAYGCAHQAPIKCEGNANRKKAYYTNSVGKLFGRPGFAQEEYEMYKIIHRYDPEHEWTLPMLEKCTVTSFDKEDEPQKCDHIVQGSKRNYDQIIYKNGGTDLSMLMKKYVKHSNTERRRVFMEVFRSIGPVMKGLSNLNSHNYHHMDIKPGNILYNGKRLSVIDFGLLHASDELYVTENASIMKFDYPYYPPEFKLFAAVLVRYTFAYFRTSFMKNVKYYDLLPSQVEQIHLELDRFCRLIKESQHAHNASKKKSDGSSSQKKNRTLTKTHVATELMRLKDKIDLYSLGICLYEFYDTMVGDDQTPLTLVAKEFIIKMTNKNPYERLSWADAIQEYERLLKVIGHSAQSTDAQKKMK